MNDESLLPRRVDVEGIATTGHELRVEASPQERVHIADVFRLVEMKSLVADVTLSRNRSRVVEISGRVTSDIVQSCVVTLEPVPQHIDEEIALRLVPGPAVEAVGEVVVEIGVDDPETYSGDSIDVGALILEHVAMAIDPYPRAPGAELPAEANDDDGSADSPFAALKALQLGSKS